jgi:hypothetical protein
MGARLRAELLRELSILKQRTTEVERQLGLVPAEEPETQAKAASEAPGPLFRMDTLPRMVEDVEDSAIFLLDAAGRIQSWNRGAERLKGYPKEQILGRHISLFYPEEAIMAGKPTRHLVQAELRGHVEDEGEQVRQDGSLFPVHVHLCALRGDSGQLSGFLMVERDLNARRDSEALSQLGQLMAGVAHEVRNPLFGISATLDALEARLGNGGAYAQHLSVLRQEAQRLTALMRDLLTYGTPISSQRLPQELAPVLEAAVSACAVLASSRGVKVELRVAPGLPRVRMEPIQLTQAFENLLTNALYFSPGGATVTLSAEPEGAWIECVVSDEGPGFHYEDLPRLFEPFFTRRPGGVGLGLPIVKRIIEQHEGRICAGNWPTAGARVVVRLPGVEDGERKDPAGG